MTFPVNSIPIFIGIGTTMSSVKGLSCQEVSKSDFLSTKQWLCETLSDLPLLSSICQPVMPHCERELEHRLLRCVKSPYYSFQRRKTKTCSFFHMPRRGLRPSFLRRPLLPLFCEEWMIISVDNLKDTDLCRKCWSSTYCFSLRELDKC